MRWNSMLACLLAAGLMPAALAAAGASNPQESSADKVDRSWLPIGPAPITGSLAEGLTGPANPATGPVTAIFAHPLTADITVAGTFNGGIWRSTNSAAYLTGQTVSWTPVAGDISGMSISAVEVDLTSADFGTPGAQEVTLYASMGRPTPSIGAQAAPLHGILTSTNTGASWSLLPSQGLRNRNVIGLVPRATRIVAAVNSFGGTLGDSGGIFFSGDSGSSFMSLAGATDSGLPTGDAHAIAGVPFRSGIDARNERLYAAIDGAGIFRSNDGGVSWANVSGLDFGGSDDVIGPSTTSIRLAVQNSEAGAIVYAAVVNGTELAAIFRAEDPEGEFNPDNPSFTWTALDLPATTENGSEAGLLGGCGGGLYLSMTVNPSRDSVIYIGGDCQPLDTTPNSLGAEKPSGRLFRIDASAEAGSQVTPLTHSAAAGTAPFQNSYTLRVDALGDLLDGNTGGIYRRVAPEASGEPWRSMNGNMQASEIETLSWDRQRRTAVATTFHTGAVRQLAPSGATYGTLQNGSTTLAAVDDVTRAENGESIVYSAGLQLAGFRRDVYDDAGDLVSSETPALQLPGGQSVTSSPAIGFQNRLALNVTDPSRGILASGSTLFGVENQLDNATNLLTMDGTVTAVIAGGFDGDEPVPGFVLAADNEGNLYRRTTGANVSRVSTAGLAGTIRALAVDPADYTQVFAATSAGIFYSTNSGTAWTEMTGNLAQLAGVSGQPPSFHALAFVPSPVETIPGFLFAGGTGGVYYTRSDAQSWDQAGTDGLPRVVTTALVYDAEGDDLVAGTLGRGIFLLDGVTDGLFSDASLAANPDVLNVTGVRGENVGSRTINLSNPSGFTIEYSGSIEQLTPEPPPNWVTLATGSSTQGELGPFDNTLISLGFDTVDLPVGSYQAELTYTGVYFDPEQGSIVAIEPLVIPINLTIESVPGGFDLALVDDGQTSFTLFGEPLRTPSGELVTTFSSQILQGQSINGTLTIRVLNNGERDVEFYTFERAIFWLSSDRPIDREESSLQFTTIPAEDFVDITFTFNVAGLPPGVYRESLTLISPDPSARNNPAVIDLRLLVSPQVGWMLY